jgi:hypothetical protein
MWTRRQLKSSADGDEAAEEGEAGDEIGESAFFLPPALRRDLEASGRASFSSRRSGSAAAFADAHGCSWPCNVSPGHLLLCAS